MNRVYAPIVASRGHIHHRSRSASPLQDFVVAIAISLTFCGYYAAMAAFRNFTSSLEGTRILTVPLRLFIVAMLVSVALNYVRRRGSIRFEQMDWGFLVFSIFYVVRIVISMESSAFTYREEPEIFLFFMAFFFLPYFLIRQIRFTHELLAKSFRFVIWGGAVFAALVIITFGDIIFTGARAAIVMGDESVLSPLFLSYCGALSMGLCIAGLLYQPIGARPISRIVLIGVIVLSAVPFFMGASRGSMIALLAPFVLFTPRNRLGTTAAKALLLVAATAILGVASVFLGSYLFDRLANIGTAVGSGSGEGSRMTLWRTSIDQFLQNPLFGNSLQNEAFNYYPHNFLLEALISTGLIGTIPLLIVLAFAFIKCRKIAQYSPGNYWIVVLFVQAFVQMSFSGAIYFASWLAAALALVVTVDVKKRTVRRKMQGKMISVVTR